MACTWAACWARSWAVRWYAAAAAAAARARVRDGTMAMTWLACALVQPRYQLFGVSMDIVQAMEQSSLPGRVHMSQEFCAVLRDTGKPHLMVNPQPDGTAFLYVPEETMSPQSTRRHSAGSQVLNIEYK